MSSSERKCAKSAIQKILKSKITYCFLLLICALRIVVFSVTPRESEYRINDTIFKGILTDVVYSDSKVKLSILIKGESLICNYYLDEKEEVPQYELGSTLEIEGVLKRPTNNTVPNTFNYKRYLYLHDTYYTCTADEISIKKANINFLYSLKNFVRHRISTFEIGDYMNSLILGDKSDMDSEEIEKYRANGVSHLFAISGMHIGLFAGFLLKFLKKLKLKEVPAYLFAIILIWLYAFLVGFSASAVRACLLFTILSLNKCFKLEVPKLGALTLSGTIILLFKPGFLFDIGFIYSFTIAFFLMYSPSFLNKHPFMGTSLVAMLASIPITILNFYEVNLASFFLNLIFVPLVSCIVYPLVLMSFMLRFLEPLAKVVINVLEWLNDIASNLKFLTFVFPKMDLLSLVLYYCVLVFLWNRNPKRYTIFLIVFIFLTKIKPFLNGGYTIDILDVGQGDSTVVITPYAKEVILIDTGGIVNYGKNSSNSWISSNTVTYLNSLGLDKIDILILTHGDYDHMGEANNIIEELKVGEVIFNNGEYNDLEQELMKILDRENIRYYKAPEELEISNNKLYFLNTRIYDNENDNSTVIYFTIDDYKFLFMGDAGVERENAILDKYDLADIDFLKVGHHGSDTSSAKEFINNIAPKYSIISVGKNNRYGHPKDSVLETLSKSKIYRTDIDGSIEIKFNENKFKIRTYSP